MENKKTYILEKRVTELRPFPRNSSTNGVFVFYKACASRDVCKEIAHRELQKLHEFDNFGEHPKIYGYSTDKYDMWYCDDSFVKVEFRAHEVEIVSNTDTESTDPHN